MTLAQGSFLCLVFVLSIIGAAAEWRSIDRVIVNLGDLPDDKYMNLHEIGGRRKETLPENVVTIGAVKLSGPGSGSAGASVVNGGSCAAAATYGRRSLLTARVRCANRNSSKPEEVSLS